MISSLKIETVTQMVKSLPVMEKNKKTKQNKTKRGSIPGLGRSPGEGNDFPIQYSCLENSMDRGTRRGIVPVVEKSWKWLSN